MNEPIISPWLFYLLGVLFPLHVFLSFAAMFSFVGSVIAFIDKKSLEESAERWPKDIYYQKQACKASRLFCRLLICFIFFSTCSVFLPNKSTVIQMVIASKVTPANINTAVDVGNKAVDKVIDKIIQAAEQYDQRINKKKG